MDEQGAKEGGVLTESERVGRIKRNLIFKVMLFTGAPFFLTLTILSFVYLAMHKEERASPAVGEMATTTVPTESETTSTTSPTVPGVTMEGEGPEAQVPKTPERGEMRQVYSFGMSFGETLSYKSNEELTSIFDDLSELGVGWVRVDLSWNTIQRDSQEQYDWSSFDRIVAKANERGILVLPILTYTPRWARASSCPETPKCEPADVEAFAMFAHVAATRYTPQGVYAWEVWNEPNIRKFWAPYADATRYTELLRETYIAIHEVDSGAVVISGGLAPTENGGGNVTAREYLEQMYGAGAQGYFDALGFHPYGFPLSPGMTKATNAWSQMAETPWNLRGIMAQYGDAYKQIWITEFGAPTGGPKGGAVSAEDVSLWSTQDHVSEAYQADMLEEALRMRDGYAWAGPLFWYSYRDLGTDASTIENFFGIRRFDGSKKEAYDALRTLLQNGYE